MNETRASVYPMRAFIASKITTIQMNPNNVELISTMLTAY